MKKSLGLICLLLLLACAGCGSNATAELTTGTYSYAGDSTLEYATLMLEDAQHFTFVYSPLSSTIPKGSFTLTEDTLQADDGTHTYSFQRKDGTLVFDADASSPLPDYAHVPDGAVFALVEQPTE